MFKSMLGELSPSAILNGTTLVLSLPEANKPVVWTLDLHKDGHGALTIDQDADTGEFILVFQGTQKGAAIIEIAKYSAKGKAIKAMQVATKALKDNPFHSSESAAATMHYPHFKSHKMSPITQWVLAILGAFIIAFLYFVTIGSPEGFERTPIGQTINKSLNTRTGNIPAKQAASAKNDTPPADAVGVPMNADNFFSSKKE